MPFPNFYFELQVFNEGYKIVAGADEVGRGAFAGPVVAATVVFSPKLFRRNSLPVLINDSKKLTKNQREKSAIWIKENSLWGMGEASVKEINRHGIKKATHSGFRRSIYAIHKGVNSGIDFLLIDGFFVPRIRGLSKPFQKAIIRGDSFSTSIAAASIIAKVYRDNLMKKRAKDFSHYHWYSNVGYGTLAHRRALIKHGPCIHHRRDFIRNTMKKT